MRSNDKKLISIIVPVYNVEEYLNDCIMSILHQTYSDFELILVDDGSTDRSSIMCDEYSKKHSNIRVVHQANCGLSFARNVGVQNSSGRYITFIDSDDIVAEDYLKCHLHSINEYDAQVSCADFQLFSDSLDSHMKSDKCEMSCYDGESACVQLLCSKMFYTSSCNLLIERKIVEDNPFPLYKYHEDEFTTFRYFLHAKRVVKNKNVLYYYRQRRGSIMHLMNNQVLDALEAADNYVNVCEHLSHNLADAANIKKFELINFILDNYPQIKKVYPKQYYERVTYLKTNALKVLLNSKSRISLKKKCLKVLFKYV